MDWFKFRLHVIYIVLGLFLFESRLSRCEEIVDMTTPTAQIPHKQKKRNQSDKEIDGTKDAGTEAKNRFEVDNLFKSQYHLDGKPLEVDTD